MHLLATTGERVLVIGADGALGSLTARAFADAGWEVVGGARSAGDDGDRRLIDLGRPETIGPGCEGVDVIINTVPDPGVAAERFVVEQGGVLVNSSALSIAHARALCARRSAAAGTVVFGAGIAPGLTSLVAAELLAAHPDADELEVVFTFSVAGTGGPAGAKFLVRNLGASRHDTIAVPLPAPFGTRECVAFAEPERAWMGHLAGVRTVRCYACFAEREVQDALLAGQEPGTIGRLRPDHPARLPRVDITSSEPVAHWVCVRRDGVRVAARTIRCAGDYLGAAHATLALANTLQDSRAHRPLPTGVFGIDELVGLADLVSYLAAVGISVVAQEL